MELTKHEREALLAGLEKLASGPAYITTEMFGICHNLDKLIKGAHVRQDLAYDLVARYSPFWAGCEGRVDSVEGTPFCAYPIRGSKSLLWEGDGLEKRRWLMAYLIDRLKAEIEQGM